MQPNLFTLLSVSAFGMFALSRSQELIRTGNVKILSLAKAGVLVKDGKMTSCELSVIDSSAAALSASCLDYTSGTTLDSSTKYDIYLDTGMNGIGAHYNADQITVHPDYNPSNFVNNIAIVQFNLNSEIAWQNKIAPVLDYSWDEIGFTRGIPSDLNELKWEGFQFNFTQLSSNSTCTGLSEMYEANAKDLVCTFGYGSAYASSNYVCPIPYANAYGLANDSAHLIGPYSFMAIEEGNNLCSFTDQRSYFTSLANYLGFIKDTIKRDVLIDSLFQFDASKLDVDYKMVDRDFKDNNGLASTKVTGDFYGGRSAGTVSASDSKVSSNSNAKIDSSASDNKSDSTESGTTSSKTSSEGSSSGGMSTKTTIIVAVCASIGGVILVSLAPFFVFWYWRRRKAMRYPIGQARYQDMIESELAGAGTRGDVSTTTSINSDPDAANQILNLYHIDLPPVYEESGEASRIADKPDKTDTKSI